jgi:hypothetical protein
LPTTALLLLVPRYLVFLLLLFLFLLFLLLLFLFLLFLLLLFLFLLSLFLPRFPLPLWLPAPWFLTERTFPVRSSLLPHFPVLSPFFLVRFPPTE